MRKFTLTTFGSSLFFYTAHAQDFPLDLELISFPNYFIVIVSGILLACGFQFLLTVLSVALGVTAVGNIKEQYVESKYNVQDNSNDDNPYDVDPGTPVGVKITSALGIWNVITVSISLFLATYLALQLVEVGDAMTYQTLALTIWAAFFLLMFYIEGKMIGSLIGGLINTAVAGLSASKDAIASIFKPSPASEMKNIAHSTVEKIRSELSSEFDTEGIVQALEKYANKIENKVPDYDTLMKDLKDVADRTGSNSGSNAAAKWTAIQSAIQTAIESNKSVDTEKAKQKTRALNNMLREIKNAYQAGDGTKDSVKNALAASPANEEKIRAYAQQLKDWLQQNTPDDMDINNMQAYFQRIKEDPKGSWESLKQALGQLDRNTIVDTLDKNTNLDRSRLNDYADQVESTLRTWSEKLGISNNDPFTESLFAKLERNVRAYIDGTSAPELNYALLKNDFTRALNNPKDSLNIAKARLSTFDRSTLRSAITGTGWVKEDQIDQVLDTIESAKNDVQTTLTTAQDKATQTMRQLERKAVINAENARKTAVSAAWWLVATIIVSGLVSTLGGSINF